MAAEIPNVIPDVMIMEATYGTHIHERREDRESRFTSTIHDIITRGGRCLIPVFALGRAQELLLILGLSICTTHPFYGKRPTYRELNLVRDLDEDTRVFSLFSCSTGPDSCLWKYYLSSVTMQVILEVHTYIYKQRASIHHV